MFGWFGLFLFLELPAPPKVSCRETRLGPGQLESVARQSHVYYFEQITPCLFPFHSFHPQDYAATVDYVLIFFLSHLNCLRETRPCSLSAVQLLACFRGRTPPSNLLSQDDKPRQLEEMNGHAATSGLSNRSSSRNMDLSAVDASGVRSIC